MNDSVLDLISDSTQAVRKLQDEVRTLQADKDRLDSSISSLNKEETDLAQKKDALKAIVSNLEKTVSDRLAESDEQIAGVRAALLDREKKLDQGEKSLLSKENAAASMVASAKSAGTQVKDLSEHLEEAFEEVCSQITSIQLEFAAKVKKLIEGI